MRASKTLTALLLASGLLLATTGCGSGSGSDSEKVLGSDTSETEENSSDDPESTAPEAQDFTVESGFTSEKNSIGTVYTSAGALLTNPNTDLAAYGAQVLFNLLGPNGDVLDTTTETVTYIGPGETVPVGPLQIGFDLKMKPAKLEVQVVGEFTADEGPKNALGAEMWLLDVTSAEITQGDKKLSAQVMNPSDEVVTEAAWDCVYLSGPKIVGGSSSAIIDPIPPGSTVHFSEYIDIDSMKANKVTCRVTSSY